MNVLTAEQLAYIESVLAPYATFFEGDHDSNTYAINAAIPLDVKDALYDYVEPTHGDIAFCENYVIIWVYVD